MIDSVNVPPIEMPRRAARSTFSFAPSIDSAPSDQSFISVTSWEPSDISRRTTTRSRPTRTIAIVAFHPLRATVEPVSQGARSRSHSPPVTMQIARRISRVTELATFAPAALATAVPVPPNTRATSSTTARYSSVACPR